MKFLQKNWLILSFAALKFLLHYVFQRPDFELHRDEYLYFEMGKHLAWGYFEVPPMIAFEGFLANLFGGSESVLRFFPYFFGATTLFFVGKITQNLGGKYFAQSLACVCFLAVPFTRINMLFQPNSLEILLFTLVFYFLVKFIQTQNPQNFIWIGVLIGLSVLNKYTTFVFIISIILGFLLTPLRKNLLKKHFFFGILAAFIIVLPNLIWQIQHHFPFFEHIRLLKKYQLSYISPIEAIKNQLIICMVSIIIWAAGLFAVLFSDKFKPFRIIGIVFLAGIFIINFQQGKPYYTLGYFPILFAFGSVFLEQIQRKKERFWLKYLYFLMPIGITLWLSVISYPMFSPEKTAEMSQKYKFLGVLQGEQGQQYPMPQDYIDMQGWQEMADKVYGGFQKLSPSQQAKTAIICGNYGQASAINYFNRNRKMPEAICINNTFIFWISPEKLNFQNVIIVDDEPDNVFALHFKTYQKIDEVKNALAREKGTQILVATDADSVVHHHVQQEYDDLRKRFFEK